MKWLHKHQFNNNKFSNSKSICECRELKLTSPSFKKALHCNDKKKLNSSKHIIFSNKDYQNEECVQMMQDLNLNCNNDITNVLMSSTYSDSFDRNNKEEQEYNWGNQSKFIIKKFKI